MPSLAEMAAADRRQGYDFTPTAGDSEWRQFRYNLQAEDDKRRQQEQQQPQRSLESMLSSVATKSSPWLDTSYKPGTISAKYNTPVQNMNLANWGNVGRVARDVGYDVANPLIENIAGIVFPGSRSAGELSEADLRAGLQEDKKVRKVAPGVYATGSNRDLTPMDYASSGLQVALAKGLPVSKFLGAGSSAIGRIVGTGARTGLENVIAGGVQEGFDPSRDVGTRLNRTIQRAPMDFASGAIPGIGGKVMKESFGLKPSKLATDTTNPLDTATIPKDQIAKPPTMSDAISGSRIQPSFVKKLDKQIDAIPLTKSEIQQGTGLGMTQRQIREAKAPDLMAQRQNLLEAIAQDRSLEVTDSLNQTGRKQTQPGEITFEQPSTAQPKSLVQKAERQEFQDVTGRYAGSVEAAKTLNTKAVAELPKLKNEDSLKLVAALEKGKASGDYGAIGGRVRQMLDQKYAQLKAAGVDIGYLEDYFPHKWKNEAEVIAQYKALKLKAGIQNERIIPTLEEGMAMGFTPSRVNYRQALQEYLNTADKLLADRAYFDTLRKRGLITESGTRPNGLVVVDASGIPEPRQFVDPVTGERISGNYYADPTVAKQINNIFGQDVRNKAGKALGVAAKVSSVAQNIGLSGGIPSTWINAFGLAQILRHLSGGSFVAPGKGGLISLSQKATNKWAIKHAESLAELQGFGNPVRSNFSEKAITSFADRVASSAADKGGIAKTFRAALSEGFHNMVDDPTFGRLMPIMQVTMYEDIKKNLMKSGVSSIKAAEIAAGRVAKFEGQTNLGKTITRSKLGKDAVTAVFFAPQYRESMINFWGEAVKSLYPPNIVKSLNPKDGAYRNNTVFLATSFASLYAMNELNKQYNGGRDMWDNPPGKEFNLMIPMEDGKTIGIPWMSSIATVPKLAIKAGKHLLEGDAEALAGDVKGTLSYAYKPLLDVATNEDYFGNKIRNPDSDLASQLKDVGGFLAGSYSHPWVKAALTSKDKPGYQIASEGLELPFRFTKTESDNTALAEKDFKQFWSKADNATKKAFERWHPGRNEFGDYEEFENNPTYSKEKAIAMLGDGELFELEKEHAKLRNKYTGKPYDPVFDLDETRRKNVLAVRGLLPGSDDWAKKALRKESWYPEYQDKEQAYYEAKKSWNESRGYASKPSDQPKPSGLAQTMMDSGNFSDPEVKSFLNANNQYTNDLRSQLGFLTPNQYQQQRENIVAGAADAKSMGEKLKYMQNVKLAGFDFYDKFFNSNPNLNPQSSQFAGFKKGGYSSSTNSAIARAIKMKSPRIKTKFTASYKPKRSLRSMV